MRTLRTTFVLALCVAKVVPFPNVTNSFCDHITDFQLDKTGSPVNKNFTYTLCMDVGAAASRVECPKGMPCPGGPDLALSVLNKGILYTVDHDGKCVTKACPSCAPPNGIPFEFIRIDGSNGGNRNFSRARVSPAPHSSFAIPKGCKPPTEGQGPGVHPIRGFSRVLPRAKAPARRSEEELVSEISELVLLALGSRAAIPIEVPGTEFYNPYTGEIEASEACQKQHREYTTKCMLQNTEGVRLAAAPK